MLRPELTAIDINSSHNLAGISPEILNKISSFYSPVCFATALINVNKKVQLDATVCRHLFTAKSLYMFRASQHPSSGVLKTVTATSGIGHNTGTATSFQPGRLRTESWANHVHLFTAKSLYMFLASQHPSSGVLKPVAVLLMMGVVTPETCRVTL